MRDQAIGLSWALLISGALLTVLEFLILDTQTFGKVAPLLLGCTILGAGGLYWYKRQPGLVDGPEENETPLEDLEPDEDQDEIQQ